MWGFNDNCKRITAWKVKIRSIKKIKKIKLIAYIVIIRRVEKNINVLRIINWY